MIDNAPCRSIYKGSNYTGGRRMNQIAGANAIDRGIAPSDEFLRRWPGC